VTARSILLVQDSAADAELVADCFADPIARGAFSLEHVGRLDAAIARLAQVEVDCLLLDLALPDALGFEGVITLDRAWPDVPIVALTGQNGAAVGEGAVQLGAQDFLVKSELTAATLARSVRYGIERHRQQALLRAAQARFQRAFDSAPIGMTLIGLDGRFLEVNPILPEMLGYQEPQLLSMSIWDILHGDDIEALDIGIRRLSGADLCTFRKELRLVGQDGQRVWALLTAAMVGGVEKAEAPWRYPAG
jgi:PAS domain S-box-containing protein